jgi:starvation-inducible outer membrane lipoprotein
MHMKNGRSWICLSALALLLAGCQAPPKDRPLTSEAPLPPSFTPPPEACTAAAVRFGLGLRVTQPLLEEMRQRAGAQSARTVLSTAPADPAQDTRRLNVQVEPTGRIVGAYCG